MTPDRYDYNPHLSGQFYRPTNPFGVQPFIKWIKRAWADHALEIAPAETALPILDPFAGLGQLPGHLRSMGLKFPVTWSCYDIQSPSVHVGTNVEVRVRDSLNHFPSGPRVIITHLPQDTEVALRAIHLALNSCTHAAFLAPAGLFPLGFERLPSHQAMAARLTGLVRTPFLSDDQTGAPVYWALFEPRPAGEASFELWDYNRPLRLRADALALLCAPPPLTPWVLTASDGNMVYSLHDLDSESISFEASSVFFSNQGLALLPGATPAQLKKIAKQANKELKKIRSQSFDFYLPAHVGFSDKGLPRRKLPPDLALLILNLATYQLYPQGI